MGSEGRVYAVDIDPDAVAAARRRIDEEGVENVEVKVSLPDDPGLPADRLDAIFLNDVIDWVERSALAGFLAGLREAIGRWRGVDHDALLANIIAFQGAVAPEAERLGVKLAIHPDDPPRPLLGLPRAVSTRADFAAMFAATPALANGLTDDIGAHQHLGQEGS